MPKESFRYRLKSWMDEKDFENRLERFLELHAGDVIKNSELFENKDGEFDGDGEFDLNAHHIWCKYLECIELHLEEFKRNEGLSNSSFKTEIELLQASDPFMVKLLFATIEFPMFISLCQDYCSQGNIIKGHK